MTLILSGTDGLSDIDGSAATPAIRGTDTNTGIYFPGADRIGFAEGGVQCGEFDASGNFLMNSGYGSAAVAYGCRAWVNFNGAANSNISGTYSQSGTAITVTAANHGLSAGQSVYLTFSTGTATAELCTVASVTSTSVFVATSATSRTTSGNCTLNFQTIRASGNVTSITDNGTGDYTVNFTSAMPDANYSVVGVTGGWGSAYSYATVNVGVTTAPTTSAVRIATRTAGTFNDEVAVCVSVFR